LKIYLAKEGAKDHAFFCFCVLFDEKMRPEL